jgi:hypothetical protein
VIETQCPGTPPNPALNLTGAATAPPPLRFIWQIARSAASNRHSITGKPEVIGSSVGLVSIDALAVTVG